MIILSGGEKGGSGKSTIAQNLSVFFAKHRKLDVMLVDADPQSTTADWRNERSKNADGDITRIHGSQVKNDIRFSLQDFAKRYDLVIVDCGGFDSEELRCGMAVADICLFPFRPKRRDLKTVSRITKLITLAKPGNPKCKHFAILSQCPSLPNQKVRVEEARQFCLEMGLEPLENYTETRNAYDDSDELGLSVLEYTDPKAQQEFINICEELINKGELHDKI